MKIVIIGGGWSGCSAALAAKKAGSDVTLIEKTDLLLGLGNVCLLYTSDAADD